VEVEKVVTKEVTKEVYTGNGVHVVCFAQGKYELTAEAKAELDNVKGSCDVVAYASPEGDVDANKTLSENRAKAVADYLTSKGVKVNKVAGEGAKNEASNRIAIVTVK
ncbi:MAG: OmpA family protein, partial [Prevotellaceae bacterium]|nr:OmpA family protein [Prevotellaceae bacterium]